MQNTFEIFVTEDIYLFLRNVKAERAVRDLKKTGLLYAVLAKVIYA